MQILAMLRDDFNKYSPHIKKWLKLNVISQNEELVKFIMNKNYVPIGEINNFYKEDNVVNPKPQDVKEWYLVTKIGYSTYTDLGYPTFEWKGIYFWGRTTTGSDLIMDYYNNSNEIVKKMEIYPESTYRYFR